jgi:predicted DNA-binding transcriptional regulator AlpA
LGRKRVLHRLIPRYGFGQGDLVVLQAPLLFLRIVDPGEKLNTKNTRGNTVNTPAKNLDLPKEGFARPAQVAHAFGVSVPTLYNWIKDGKLPKPEKDGTRITRWPVAVIREYLARQGGAVLALSGRQDISPCLHHDASLVHVCGAVVYGPHLVRIAMRKLPLNDVRTIPQLVQQG